MNIHLIKLWKTKNAIPSPSWDSFSNKHAQIHNLLWEKGFVYTGRPQSVSFFALIFGWFVEIMFSRMPWLCLESSLRRDYIPVSTEAECISAGIIA